MMNDLVIAHLSDVHYWRYTLKPTELLGKRAVGMLELVAGRGRRFVLERMPEIVARVRSLAPDHILITGDLTTTALDHEFLDARNGLAELLTEPERVTVLPGNHDRYTRGAVRHRAFEAVFGAYLPAPRFPWLRRLGPSTAILGLDPTRSHLTATGHLPRAQLEEARALLEGPAGPPRRLIVACHYPVAAPAGHRWRLFRKGLTNAGTLSAWLGTIGRHVYCCGHVHAAWAFTPKQLPDQLCVNSGPPLIEYGRGRSEPRPGFVELRLSGPDVMVTHHGWSPDGWTTRSLAQRSAFFGPPDGP